MRSQKTKLHYLLRMGQVNEISEAKTPLLALDGMSQCHHDEGILICRGVVNVVWHYPCVWSDELCRCGPSMGVHYLVQGVEQGEVCAYIMLMGVKYVSLLFWCCVYTHPATHHVPTHCTLTQILQQKNLST